MPHERIRAAAWAFYPGGWPHAMEVYDANYRANRAIIPDFQMLPPSQKF
jgi:hypothetical protein